MKCGLKFTYKHITLINNVINQIIILIIDLMTILEGIEMELEIGKLNSFYIGKSGRPHAILTNATEDEFTRLLESYISENESQDGRDFQVLLFENYVTKNGYYIKTGNHDLNPPNTS